MAESDGYYDDLETRDPEEREGQLFANLPAHIGHAQAKSVAYAEILADIDPAAVTDRAALAELPVVRKHQFMHRQRTDLPFGGVNTVPVSDYLRVFHSPGPYYVPQPDSKDFWRMARALFAAGFRPGHLIHNAFSYHFTPGAWLMEDGARALGCPVFPAGVGQTELQAQTIAELKPRYYAGTPSFLRIILEKGAEIGADLSSLVNACVSGEAFPPSLQTEIEGYGIDAYQCYGTAELGLVAYESVAREGLILDERIIVEIVRPGTDEPVPEGEVGELVVTTLCADYPLIRFSPGDLSAFMAGQSPCGRTNRRVRGWMGRADQTTKVKGMFVHPHQVADVLKRHLEVTKCRLVVDKVDGVDVMILNCETTVGGDALEQAITDSVQSVCKLKGRVALVKPGSLPNDGKVIDDVRTYE